MSFFLSLEIILLDEPTSGLDSHTARYLVSNLRDLAHDMNKMVILTIHQPSSDIFGMFDQIGILSQGEVVYFGSAQELVPYFTDLGYPCNAYTNPLDRYGKNVYSKICVKWPLNNRQNKDIYDKL